MARQVILKRRLWLGSYELTRQMRALNEVRERAALDSAGWGDDTDIFEPGRLMTGVAGEGFWRGGEHEIDNVLFTQVDQRNVPVTLALTDGSPGSPARLMQANVAEVQFGGTAGELVAVSFRFSAAEEPADVHAVVGFRAAPAANMDGPIIDMGANPIAATERLYAALHVLSGASACTVRIRSSAAANFANPVNRLTFAAVAGAVTRTSEWKSIAGPQAHRYWRVRVETAGARDIAVAFGVA